MVTGKASVETILFEAIEIESAAERAAFVERACTGDALLQHEVERLIAHHLRAGSFLDIPAAGTAPTVVVSSNADISGQQIGPYKLRELLGEGGMGTVFVAEQQQPVRRKVAMKLIKLGMDSRQVLSRFEAERQALSLMDHPNIARVLDAGITDNGRPYFVMEFVRGLPITEHCDQHKLGTRERLELFLQVCRAVQHAHQKGIIHRDLKPSNVLVAMHDTQPVVKVIDFGVAKAIGQSLTDMSLYTGIGDMVGTPLYMSPEQAGQSSLDVDTRSDVYSLGVLLYELLTGCTPFEKESLKQASFDELRRIIREIDPPRPSTRFSTLNAAALSTIAQHRDCEPRRLSLQLSGDLDWIVMKAMEKDRVRRYESASSFVADVQRYLDDEPVEACPPSTAYRLRKYARRNRTMLTTLIVVSTALILGTGVSIWQAIVARDARRTAETNFTEAEEQRKLADQNAARAEREFKKSLQAVDRMLLRVGDYRLAAIPQAEPIRQELFKDAIEFYEGFLKEHQSDQALQFEIGKAWFNLSELYGFEGKDSEDIAAKTNALKILEELRLVRPSDLELLETLARASRGLGRVQHYCLYNRAAGESAYLRALELRKEIEQLSPKDSNNRITQATIQGDLSNLYIWSEDLPQAEKHLLQAREIVTKEVSESSSADWLHQRSGATFVLASLYCNNLERPQEGEELFLEAIRYGELAVAKGPQLLEASSLLGMTLLRYAEFLDRQGRSPEAEQYFKRSLETLARLNREHPNFRTGIRFLKMTQSSAARNREKLGSSGQLMRGAVPINADRSSERRQALEDTGGPKLPPVAPGAEAEELLEIKDKKN